MKETFRPVALRGMRENREYLVELVRRSELMDGPEVGRTAVLNALSGDVEDLSHDA